MKTAMGNGTAALLAFQKAMNVESHNAGNTRSLGYKADTVSFSDMFYSNSVGLGVDINTPRKDFSQGGLEPTNSEYDFAIDGEGFFTLQDPLDPDKYLYSRAGQFKSDVNNLLADLNGNLVLGVPPVVDGDIINATHTESITSQIITTDEKTMSINTYATDYVKTISALESMGTSGDGFKSSGAILSDVDEMLYRYTNALKAYSINPVDGVVPTKSTATISVSPLTHTDEAYSIVATVNGVKFQQDFDTSVENTLKLFSDQLSGFTGITSSVDTVTGDLTITSMIPGDQLNIRAVELNNNNLPFTLNQGVEGSGLALSDAIRDEIKLKFDEINADLDGALNTQYSGLSNLDKFYIYDNLTETEKEEFVSSLGEDLATLQTTYSNDENALFSYLIGTHTAAVDTYLTDKFKSRYDEADLAENKSSINHLESGVLASTSLETVVLDLHALNMNTTLYDKLVTDEDTVAAYPGIESDNGKLYLRDGDSRFLVAVLPPVIFSDKTLLRPEGDSVYTAIADPLIEGSVPPVPVYIEGAAKIYGTYLEYSNVDISEQLVNLLSFQKAFEANSKSISTSDEMMKTALALKTK